MFRFDPASCNSPVLSLVTGIAASCIQFVSALAPASIILALIFVFAMFLPLGLGILRVWELRAAPAPLTPRAVATKLVVTASNGMFEIFVTMLNAERATPTAANSIAPAEVEKPLEAN
jgi:hypothetical protein